MPSGFVKTDATRFVLDGAAFPVVGINSYFLSFCSDGARSATLDAIRQTGANVIRSWGFLDRLTRTAGQPAFQYKDGGQVQYNDGPDGLQLLDSLVSMAEQYGLRLILPLLNYWENPLGGLNTYLQWLIDPQDIPQDAGAQAQLFYQNANTKNAFKNWINHIVTRRNAITGTLYADSPAILGWELANEPRCTDSQVLLPWVQEMSLFVKSLDSNHLLAVGDEGFYTWETPPNSLYSGGQGLDFDATLAIREIDFGTYHFYPDSMKVPIDFGSAWIRDHVNSGQHANKPVLLEEYGIAIAQPSEPDEYRTATVAERNGKYSEWLETVYDSRGAGDLLWMMGCHRPDVQGYYDEYTVYSATDIPFLGAHATAMRNRAES
jgi:mannan endo-1,4-beta-mannosidase